MKILINSGGWSSRYIVLPVEHAALAAGLLAHATLYEDDGSTPEGKHYKLTKDSELSISYAQDNQFEALPASVVAARKEAAEASQARWKAEGEARELRKKLDETTAALEALKAVTVCTASEPEQSEGNGDEPDGYGVIEAQMPF